MRTLVSIQKVATVNPIPEADAIEVLTMENLGWNVVIKKDQFKPGDLCIYFEIDSLEEFKSMYKPDSIFLVKGDYHISEDSNVFIIGPDVTLLPPETAANMDMQFNKYILSKTNG